MLDLVVALAQFLCIVVLVYGAILTLLHRGCVDAARATYDPLSGHEWLRKDLAAIRRCYVGSAADLTDGSPPDLLAEGRSLASKESNCSPITETYVPVSQSSSAQQSWRALPLQPHTPQASFLRQGTYSPLRRPPGLLSQSRVLSITRVSFRPPRVSTTARSQHSKLEINAGSAADNEQR